MDPFDLRLWPNFITACGGGNPIQRNHPSIIDQVSVDSRRISSSSALFVALQGNESDGHKFIPQAIANGAKYILLQKDWPLDDHLQHNACFLRVENPLFALQEIAKAYRTQLKAKIIAIAGSYGKTMVKDLLQDMLSTKYAVGASPESFNSQLGVALSLFTLSHKHDFGIIEAGISISGEMDRLADMIQPDYMIITPVGKKHLATLGSVENLTSEIMKLGQNVPKGNWMLLPSHDHLQPLLPQLKGVTDFWDQENPLLPQCRALDAHHDASLSYKIRFPDGAEHSGEATSGFAYFIDLMNMASKAAWLTGICSKSIASTLQKFQLEPIRTEIWKSPTGITFINDAYCSDPQSILRSLRDFSKKKARNKVFVFGGMRREKNEVAEQQLVADSIVKAGVSDLILIGSSSQFQTLIDQLKAKPVRTMLFNTHSEAIQFLGDYLKQDDAVLIKGDKKVPLNTYIEAFNDSICTNQCLVNLAAIESNIHTIQSKLPTGSRIMVIVKAQAYGTNDVQVSQFLESAGIDILGVSYVDEAVSLRRAGIKQSLFVLNAASFEAAKVVKWDLEIGVSEKETIFAIAKEAESQSKYIKVHLHIDTGMSRFGCRPEEALPLAQLIKSLPGLCLEGIMTHFASAEDKQSDKFTLDQASCFLNVINTLEQHNIRVPWKHAANSSAALRFHFPEFNMVRIGLATYGLYPSEEAKQSLDLRLAISLSSRIVGINTCHEGETISYGRTYRVQKEKQRIAVIPIGYFDGLHRNYSGKSHVLIRGKKAPMVGRICMDFMMVDVTDIPQAKIGDSVLIFGEDEHGRFHAPEDFAANVDTIIHELITCLGPRIQRIFIHEERAAKR